MNDDEQPLDVSLRQVTSTYSAQFKPYNRYGDPIEGMYWIPLQGDAAEGFESFLLKIEPGTSSLPHEHTGGESFFVIEGEITDCDGKTFQAGDYVAYQPGSKHYSISESGCTLLTILNGPNKRLE